MEIANGVIDTQILLNSSLPKAEVTKQNQLLTYKFQ